MSLEKLSKYIVLIKCELTDYTILYNLDLVRVSSINLVIVSGYNGIYSKKY